MSVVNSPYPAVIEYRRLVCKQRFTLIKGKAVANITTTTLPAPIQASFNYKLLSVPTPQFIFKLPAMKYMMPAKGGTILRFRRYASLPAATIPLGNSGNTPPSTNITAVNIDAEINFYGQYLMSNEQVVLQNQDPKMYGVYKSFLIDLEPAADNAGGNKAQARAICAA